MKLKSLSIALMLSLGLTACGEKKVSVEIKEEEKVATTKIEKVVDKNDSVNVGREIVEGKDYKILEVPFELNGIPDNSLVEVFWLGCPHCQKFEQGVREEKSKFSKEMPFFKVHAVRGNPQWLRDAYVFNIVKKLSNNNEKTLALLFDLYTNTMNEYKEDYLKNKEETKLRAYPTLDEIRAFLSKNNIKEEDFNNLFNSEEIKEIVKSHGEAFNKSKLQGVPAFIVNKKYLVTGAGIRSYKEYFEVVNAVFEKTKK
jgi:thiol:disulfide interchange protein DsbA